MGVVDKKLPERRGNLKKAKECLQVDLKESHGLGLPKDLAGENSREPRKEGGRKWLTKL